MPTPGDLALLITAFAALLTAVGSVAKIVTDKLDAVRGEVKAATDRIAGADETSARHTDAVLTELQALRRSNDRTADSVVQLGERFSRADKEHARMWRAITALQERNTA